MTGAIILGLTINPLFFLAFGLLVIATVFILFFAFRARERSQTLKSLHTVLLLVTLPQHSSVHPKEYKEYAQIAEQFFASMSGLLERSRKVRWPALTFEISVHHIGEEIRFYISTPEELAEATTKHIQALYPEAYVEPIDDYNIFHPSGATAGCFVTFERDSLLPIKDFSRFTSDPIASLATNLTRLAKEEEGVSLQIVLRKGNSSLNEKARSVARRLAQGMSLKEALRGSAPKNEKEKVMSHRPLGPAEEQMANAILQKASQVNFGANIRLVVSAQTQSQADAILNNISDYFSQFALSGLNSFKINRAKGALLKRLAFNYSFRLFSPRESFYLSSGELSGVFHFPPPGLAVPQIAWLKAKPAEPPLNLPPHGLILGENAYRGVKRIVRIAPDDRRRHMYVVGQTGTGKTTFLKELIRQDIAEGNGVAVIDPHGDLAESLLGVVPKNRIDDVIYFNPGLSERPMGLNMLEWSTEDQRDFAVSEMISIFLKLFPPEMTGPLFEHNMRNAMLTLAADKDNPGTIVEIPRIFTDKEFVREKLKDVHDPLVRSFWEKEMAQTSDFHRSEMLGYLISKLGRFIENATMRNIIGQPRSAFNFRDIMDSGKILFANLAKGKLGEINSHLLGMILVSKLQMAALSRGDVMESMRRDFYLYVDEFQNFTTDSFASILSEARKYRLSLTVAHQFIAQLPPAIRDAVFGNIGTLVAFRVGSEDGDFLARQMEPVFSSNDLINMDNYNAYIKMIINGAPARPFNLRTLVKPPAHEYWGEQVRVRSLGAYTKSRELVEREIAERLSAASASVLTQ